MIVERASTEKNLPLLDKAKFLVPSHVSLHEFIRVLRRRMELSPGQALFLMSSRGLPPGTQSIAELWDAVSLKSFSLTEQNGLPDHPGDYRKTIIIYNYRMVMMMDFCI